MRTALVTVVSLFLVFAIPAPAKLKVVKIAFRGASFATPIEIADRDFSEFEVFAGPGTHVNGEEQEKGFIIDWAQGVVPPPDSNLAAYEVEFYGGCFGTSANCNSDTPRLIYVVSYALDLATGRGFVYLPSRSPNTQTIWRGGLEGNWFRGTSEWNAFVWTLVENDSSRRN